MSAAPLVPAYSLPERNRRVLLVNRPVAIPQASDFVLDEMPLKPVPEEMFRVRNIYLSVDPAQRGWAAATGNYSEPVKLGGPMRALAVGVIVESRHEQYRVGDHVYGWFGWQDYAIAGPAHVLTQFKQPTIPLSAYAGVLGINGLTAFLALTKLGRPQAGEAILVSTAGGAVGSIVGQLAKSKGLRVVGLTGTDQKAARLTKRYSYDVGVNYRSNEWESLLTKAAPDGFDVYFDNVGGAILDGAMRRMRSGGRIVQCGTASIAAWEPAPMGLRNEREILTRRLVWSGFIVFDHAAEFSATTEVLAQAVLDGSLVYDEDISSGIDGAAGSIAALYSGENEGKKLIFIG